jgi:hypothetical protein
MSLLKSIRLYFRRLETKAEEIPSTALNAQARHEFAIAPGLQFDPTAFAGFFNDF